MHVEEEKLNKKLCVTIKGKNIKEIKRLVKDLDFVEIRVDLIDDFDYEKDINKLRKIINYMNKVIFTIKKDKFNFKIRKELVLFCFLSNISYIDIEYDDIELIKYFFHFKSEFLEFNNRIKTKVNNKNIILANIPYLIISYHNYNEFPAFKESYKIIKKIIKNNPDFIKFIVYSKKEDFDKLKDFIDLVYIEKRYDVNQNKTNRENKIGNKYIKKLLSEIKNYKNRVIFFTMGEYSLFSRTISVKKGAPFTYVALSKDKRAVSDQPTKEEFIKYYFEK